VVKAQLFAALAVFLEGSAPALPKKPRLFTPKKKKVLNCKWLKKSSSLREGKGGSEDEGKAALFCSLL